MWPQNIFSTILCTSISLSYNFIDCVFRLVGLVEQGSIPWTIFGLVVFAQLVVMQFVIQAFSQEVFMRLKERFYLLIVSLLETVWSVEVNIVAVALPA